MRFYIFDSMESHVNGNQNLHYNFQIRKIIWIYGGSLLPTSFGANAFDGFRENHFTDYEQIADGKQTPVPRLQLC